MGTFGIDEAQSFWVEEVECFFDLGDLIFGEAWSLVALGIEFCSLDI